MPTPTFRAAPPALLLTILASALALLGGCDKSAKDKAEIREMWKQLTHAVIVPDGEAAAKYVAPRTFEHYQKVMGQCLDASASAAKALPPTQMMDVLRFRNRCKRADVKGLDGKGFYKFTVKQGWRLDFDDAWALDDIRVSGDSATAVMIHPGAERAFETAKVLDSRVRGSDPRGARRREVIGFFDGKRETKAIGKPPPKYPVRLVKEGGQWKLDETSLHGEWDQEIRDEARAVQMGVPEYLELYEFLATENELRPKVWEPLKK